MEKSRRGGYFQYQFLRLAKSQNDWKSCLFNFNGFIKSSSGTELKQLGSVVIKRILANLTLNSTMKTTLILSSLLLILFSCDLSSDQDYKDIAKDTCGCMSLFTDNLSEEMQTILAESDGDEAAFDAAFTKYMEENPIEGLKDAQALAGAESPEVMGCMEKLEKKYDNVYTTLSETEIVERVITELENMGDCGVTVAIMKMGLAAQ